MYNTISNQQNIQFLTEAIAKLQPITSKVFSIKDFWVCYGSFALGTQTPKSDVDFLYVHQSRDTPIRIQAFYEGFPVTIYSLSAKEFIADGTERRYGGYFSGKMLNPYILFPNSSEIHHLINQTAANFIAPFAASLAYQRGVKNRSAEALTADVFLAYLWLCPSYKAYFVRYFNSANFKKIWETMCQIIPQGLLSIGAVHKLGDDEFKYNSNMIINDIHDTLVRTVASFWAFGSWSHKSNRFPEAYFRKAKQYLQANNLHNACKYMIRFLEKTASEK